MPVIEVTLDDGKVLHAVGTPEPFHFLLFELSTIIIGSKDVAYTLKKLSRVSKTDRTAAALKRRFLKTGSNECLNSRRLLIKCGLIKESDHTSSLVSSNDIATLLQLASSFENYSEISEKILEASEAAWKSRSVTTSKDHTEADTVQKAKPRKKKITKEGTIPRLPKPYPRSLQKDIDNIKAIVCTPGAPDRAATGEMLETTFDNQIAGGLDPYLNWLLKTNKIKVLRLEKSHVFHLDWINDFLAYWKQTAGKDSYSTRSYALKSIITACKYYVRDKSPKDAALEHITIAQLKKMSSDLFRLGCLEARRLAQAGHDARGVDFDSLVQLHRDHRDAWLSMPAKSKRDRTIKAKFGFRYIVTGLFYRVAAVRPSSIAKLSVSPTDSSGNRSQQFINFKDDREAVTIEYLGHNAYKNHSQGKDLKIEVTDEDFAKDLRTFYNTDRNVLLGDAESDTFLFGVASKKQITTGNLSAHFERGTREFAGESLTPKQVRHLACTALLSDDTVTINQLEAVAAVMHTSVHSMRRSYDDRSTSNRAQAGAALLSKRGRSATECAGESRSSKRAKP